MTEVFAPLRGIRVVDMSRYLPGPCLTRVLADMGAEVLKVEPPSGDLARWMPPHVDGFNALFASLNAGKRFVGIDTRKPEGVALVRELLKDADVLVESWRPGILARMGLSPESLLEAFPRLIVVSMSGYGQDGPLRDRVGHDINYIARAGVLGQCGPQDGPAAIPGGQVADIGGGSMSAATGVLAALLERHSTGRGRHLDISLERGALGFATYALANTAAGSDEARGGGTLTGGLPCYRCYRCEGGGQLAVGALEQKFWSALCARIERPDLASDGYASGERGAWVHRELEAVFASRTRDAWVEHFGGLDVCVEPVRTPAEVLADAHLSRNITRLGNMTVVHPDVGVPGGHVPPTPPRAIGADNESVWAEVKPDPAVLQAARDSGAIS